MYLEAPFQLWHGIFWPLDEAEGWRKLFGCAGTDIENVGSVHIPSTTTAAETQCWTSFGAYDKKIHNVLKKLLLL